MRRPLATITTVGGVLLLLGGCTSPKLLRHYEGVGYANPPTQDLQLSIFPANPKANNDEPLIAGLSERAQAELIRSMAASSSAKGKSGEELLALINKAPDGPSKSCAWAVNNSLTKRVNLAVLGDLQKPADRIDKLDITLALSSSDAKLNRGPSAKRASFASWDRFDSVYGTFNIGSAKFTQSSKVSVGRTNTNTSNLADSAGSVVKVLDLGAEADRSLEESATYALRRLSVGGALTPSTARLVQEGGPNMNLFGSSAVTLSLALATNTDPRGVYAFVLEKDGNQLTANMVKIERCQDTYPISNAPITADVNAEALLREVTSGDGTVSEGDDQVQMRWTPLKLINPKLVLASTKDLTVERYTLARCGPGDGLDRCEQLHVEHNGATAGGTERILLPSMGAATDLRAWLIAQAKVKKVETIGGRAVGIARPGANKAAKLSGLTSDQASKLRVIFAGDNE